MTSKAKPRSIEDIKQQIAELTDKRNRTHRRILTHEKRERLLNEIYDGALFWLKQCVISGATKGSSTAAFIMKAAREELQALTHAREEKAMAPQRIVFEYMSSETIVNEQRAENADYHPADSSSS